MLKYVWCGLWSETYGKPMNNRWVTAPIDSSVYVGFLLKGASSWIWYRGCKIKPTVTSSISSYSCFSEHEFYFSRWIIEALVRKSLTVITVKSHVVAGCFNMKLNSCSLMSPCTTEGECMFNGWLQSHKSSSIFLLFGLTAFSPVLD